MRACVRAEQRPPPDTDGHRSPLGGCVPLAHANAVPIGCRPAERRSIARCGEEARDRASGGDASGKQSRCIHLCTYLFSSYAHLALPAQVHGKVYRGISSNKFNSSSEWLFRLTFGGATLIRVYSRRFGSRPIRPWTYVGISIKNWLAVLASRQSSYIVLSVLNNGQILPSLYDNYA